MLVKNSQALNRRWKKFTISWGILVQTNGFPETDRANSSDYEWARLFVRYLWYHGGMHWVNEGNVKNWWNVGLSLMTSQQNSFWLNGLGDLVICSSSDHWIKLNQVDGYERMKDVLGRYSWRVWRVQLREGISFHIFGCGWWYPGQRLGLFA